MDLNQILTRHARSYKWNVFEKAIGWLLLVGVVYFFVVCPIWFLFEIGCCECCSCPAILTTRYWERRSFERKTKTSERQRILPPPPLGPTSPDNPNWPSISRKSLYYSIPQNNLLVPNTGGAAYQAAPKMSLDAFLDEDEASGLRAPY